MNGVAYFSNTFVLVGSALWSEMPTGFLVRIIVRADVESRGFALRGRLRAGGKRRGIVLALAVYLLHIVGCEGVERVQLKWKDATVPNTGDAVVGVWWKWRLM